MSENVEKETLGIKVSYFAENHKKGLIITGIVLLALLIIYIIGYAIGKSAKEKDLAKIDEITFTLVDNSIGLDDAELTARRTAGIESLQSLVSKSGIVGARANMLCAEISYQLGKFDDAASYWEATAAKGKKSYIEPIAYYNLGACYENLGKLEEAVANYKLAAENKDFILNTHAQFSYGRVLEASGKYVEAVNVYKALNDQDPEDSWAKLAKTRIITLQAEGKAE